MYAASRREKTKQQRKVREDEEVGVGGKAGMRNKWEQKTKKGGAKSKKGDCADWESQGKGQLPLQHFSLIEEGNSGLDKSSFVLIY